MGDTVVVIETGDYEERIVFGVAADLDSAVDYVKGKYPAPYVVRWDPLDDGCLVGHFETVPHFSSKHIACYDLTEVPVHALTAAH